MKNSLIKSIQKLAEDRNIELSKEDLQLLFDYTNLVSSYIGKRAYHLMDHCNRRNIQLRDTKNAIRIEINDEKICENIIKYSNYIVTRYFQIQKGYSLPLLNELFNYDRICPSKILIELDIHVPFHHFKKVMPKSRSYTIQNEASIFLVSSIQSLIINILNSYKGYLNQEKKITMSTILENYKCHSDFIE